MKRVNMNLAWMGVVFSAMSSILLLEYYREILAGSPSYTLGSMTLFLSLISTISLLIVYRQWSVLLNINVLETLKLSEQHSVNLNERPFVPNWPYIAFIAFWFLEFLFAGIWIFSLLQLIFFVIFLHYLFETIRKLQEIKIYLYRTLFNIDYKPVIKERNVLSVFLLTLLTLGVYWLYLVVRLSQEINEFLDMDDRIMRNLEVKS
ncbi:hypothetical protein AS158_05950 [Thermotoga sp. 38H-to]|nr:hypothetical protein AS158_05950 [Thermotoga sp. 38H-to]